MLDIIGNLDIVNQIVQAALDDIKKKQIEVRWNFLSSDIGYLVDISEPTKKQMVVQINALSNRQNLCKFFITKNEIIIRYTNKLLFTYKNSTNTFSTNLFDEPFFIDDLESTFFTQRCLHSFGAMDDIVFDYDIMISTLKKAQDLYYAYLVFVQKRENANTA